MPHSPSKLTAIGFLSAAVKAKSLDEKKALLIQRGAFRPNIIIGQAFDAAVASAKLEIRLQKTDPNEIRTLPSRAEIREEQRNAKGFVPNTWGDSATSRTDLIKRAEDAMFKCGKAAQAGQYDLAVAYCKLIKQANAQGLVTLDLDHLSRVTTIPKLELQARLKLPFTELDMIALRRGI